MLTHSPRRLCLVCSRDITVSPRGPAVELQPARNMATVSVHSVVLIAFPFARVPTRSISAYGTAVLLKSPLCEAVVAKTWLTARRIASGDAIVAADFDFAQSPTLDGPFRASEALRGGANAPPTWSAAYYCPATTPLTFSGRLRLAQ